MPRPLPAAALALAALLLPARAAVVSGWPEGPGDGLLVAPLPPGETTVHDLTVEGASDGSLFVAWIDSGRNDLFVQKVTSGGSRAFGASGALVRSTVGLDLRPPGDPRPRDARGPLGLFPASDGGVLVCWSEQGGLGRDLRVQRLGPGGSTVFGPDGVAVFSALPNGEESAAVFPDGVDGVLALGAFGAGGAGTLRHQHLRADGSLAFPVPGLPADGSAAAKAYPVLARLADGAAACVWWRDDGAGLRFQVFSDTGARLAADGMALAQAGPGWASVRVAGSSIPGYVLVSYRLGVQVRLLLVTATGQVLRDEKGAEASLTGPAEITAVTATVTGLPEGIELRGIRPDLAAERYVRAVGGGWRAAQAVVPPFPAADADAGALAGPAWTWWAGARDLPAGGSRSLVGYRDQDADDFLAPTLGPWLAVAPGFASRPALARNGPWLFAAWVLPDPAGGAILGMRAGAAGAPDVLDADGLELRTLTVSRSRAGTAVLKGSGFDVTLPTFPDPASPAAVRLRVGTDAGTVAVLDLVSFEGRKNLSWTATLAGAGGVSGTVKAGILGHGLKVRVAGLPADAAERAASLRLEIDSSFAQATTVLLKTNASGRKSTFPRK